MSIPTSHLPLPPQSQTYHVDVNHKSGLYGSTGLQSGMVVDRINECEVRDGREWTRCLEALHEKQKLQFRTGYLVQYAKVRPMTASPDHVTSTAGSGEMQCCSGDNTLNAE